MPERLRSYWPPDWVDDATDELAVCYSGPHAYRRARAEWLRTHRGLSFEQAARLSRDAEAADFYPPPFDRF